MAMTSLHVPLLPRAARAIALGLALVGAAAHAEEVKIGGTGAVLGTMRPNRVGHIMGLQAVGECAESEAVIDELRALGVDFAQGYGVQRPRPLPLATAAAAATLASQPAATPWLDDACGVARAVFATRFSDCRVRQVWLKFEVVQS